ncbi:hypothetical protein ON010_g14829 [Phytophthora cinnamomi]|nr:hypothetical protein ON010_g14829 [Phytophthora cinnamomi]
MLFLRHSITSLLIVVAMTEATNLRQEQRQLQTDPQSDDYFSLMRDRVNQARAAEGLPALCTNKKPQEAAQQHSDDQAANNNMDHTGTDGSNVEQSISGAGFDWNAVAENFEECDNVAVADTITPTQVNQENETEAPGTDTPVVEPTNAPATELPEETPAATVNPSDIPILRRRRFDS